MVQLAKNPPIVFETWVRSLGWEDPLEKGKATHSSILAWRSPRTTVHGVAKSQTPLSDFHFTHPGATGAQWLLQTCPSSPLKLHQLVSVLLSAPFEYKYFCQQRIVSMDIQL